MDRTEKNRTLTMKNQILTSIIAIRFAAIIANTPAVAENNHTATVPFSFQAGGTEYPSGTYQISRLGVHSVVKITNLSNGSAHIVSTPISVGPNAGNPKLVFLNTADGYKLSEVWLQGLPGMKTVESTKGQESARVKVSIR